jgi:ferredoxin-NADP reductase
VHQVRAGDPLVLGAPAGAMVAGTQSDRDVYISGPDHMIVTTARVLRERGAASRLIHYDLNPKAGQGL